MVEVWCPDDDAYVKVESHEWASEVVCPICGKKGRWVFAIVEYDSYSEQSYQVKWESL